MSKLKKHLRFRNQDRDGRIYVPIAWYLYGRQRKTKRRKLFFPIEVLKLLIFFQNWKEIE